jgi:CRP/FNR family cyclic AMP-dependent transcriptional regulator
VWNRSATFAAVSGRLEEISRAETMGMLQAVPLFTGLTKRQLVAVSKVVDHLSFEPGAVLVKELDVGRRLIIIRQGTAEVRRHGTGTGDGATGDANDRRLATVGPGDVVGELSLIDGKPTSASVVAETQLEALVIYGTRFKKLVGSMPQLYPQLLVGMAARVRDLDRRAVIG